MERRNRRIFWLLFGVTGLALYGGGLWLVRCLGLPDDARRSAATMLPLYVSGVAGVVASLAWRALGLSQSSKTAETVRLTGATSEWAARDGRIVRRLRPEQPLAPVAAAGLFTAGAAIYAYLVEPLIWGVAALLGLVTASGWHQYRVQAIPEAEVDSEGISARGRRAAWEDVGACRIVARRDILGQPAGSECVVLGHAGQELLRINLTLWPEEQRQRFLDLATAGQVGRAELLAADAPAGRGTELSAEARSGEPALDELGDVRMQRGESHVEHA